MNIYVLIPYGLVTGGPDALHQLVYYLRKLNLRAYCVYLGASLGASIPSSYSCYISNYLLISDIIDEPKSIVIIPESLSHLSSRFKKTKIFIWWLSVDYNLKNTSFLYKSFFFITIPLRVVKNHKKGLSWIKSAFYNTLLKSKYNFKNESENVSHLCASYYALKYVSEKSNNQYFLCIEPISKYFLDMFCKNVSYGKRKNIVLYNPAKCEKFVRQLKKNAPNINFVALKGMSQFQLIEHYKTAKLYIDFGPFPGAERMPKEAVLFGCAILTGKSGASAYYDDVPISNKYKIEASSGNINKIIEKIDYMLKNYESIIKDFEVYKDTVLRLETNFIAQLENIFEDSL